MKRTGLALLCSFCVANLCAAGTNSSFSCIYETERQLERLSADQEALIARLANRHVATNRQVWFVLVADSGSRFHVNVYYTPDSKAGRIQTGKMVSLDSMFIIEGTFPVGSPDTYYWVAPGDGNEAAEPSSAHLPFVVEGELPDQSILAIVDLARSQLETSDGPIMSIRRQGTGSFEVTTASSRRPLAGRGAILVIGKKDGRWTIVRRGWWLS